MTDPRATVVCAECALEETFATLGAARTAIEIHRTETGHDAAWELGRLASGVERAGDDAGVCGREACANPDSPLASRE
ncbi:hypothetical protein ACFQJD_16185 [Haloplanus sp. GCM10025708]|uniref:DUF7542 family protein n=1 Tax=Haloferacaceae TaxID=1644056 RepID=UPI00360F6386